MAAFMASAEASMSGRNILRLAYCSPTKAIAGRYPRVNDLERSNAGLQGIRGQVGRRLRRTVHDALPHGGQGLWVHGNLRVDWSGDGKPLSVI